MWEFCVKNIRTGEKTTIIGNTIDKAFRIFKLNEEDWVVLWSSYID